MTHTSLGFRYWGAALVSLLIYLWEQGSPNTGTGTSTGMNRGTGMGTDTVKVKSMGIATCADSGTSKGRYGHRYGKVPPLAL